MKLKIFFSWLAMIFVLSATAKTPIDEGKTIFTSRCASCHNPNVRLVGPALAGVQERRSMEWIISFVQSSQTLVKKGDKTANELFASFNNIPMPDHKDLSADQIRSIVEYIKSETKTVAEKAPLTRLENLRPAYVPISANNYWAFAAILLGIGLLVFSLLLFAWTKQLQRKLAEKQ